MGGRRERNKQGGFTYVSSQPTVSPELWRLKLHGVTSPLLGWSFVVSITWSITSRTQPGSPGRLEVCGASSFAFVLS